MNNNNNFQYPNGYQVPQAQPIYNKPVQQPSQPFENKQDEINSDKNNLSQLPPENKNKGDSSKGLCIAGFVLSFFVNVLGLIFSIIGVTKSKKNTGKANKLGVAGIIISVVAIVLSVALMFSTDILKEFGLNNIIPVAPSATASGEVRWLNEEIENKDVLDKIAKDYTKKTGVKVTITYVEPDNYLNEFNSVISSENAPTMFTFSNTEEAKSNEIYCLDLKTSSLKDNVINDSLITYAESGKMITIPINFECYGFMANKSLIEKDESLSIDKIKSYQDFVSCMSTIHQNLSNNKFDAYTSCALLPEYNADKYTLLLSNIALYYEKVDDSWTTVPSSITGKYFDKYESWWKNLIGFSPIEPTTLSKVAYDPVDEFGSGHAAFCMGTSADYKTLVNDYKINRNDLYMLPIYYGVDDANQGLCCNVLNSVAVNSFVKEDDKNATINFIKYITTNEDAVKNLNKVYEDLAYNNVKHENRFILDAITYMNEGKTNIPYLYKLIPEQAAWKNRVAEGLADDIYSQNSDMLEAYFIKGWGYGENEYTFVPKNNVQ